MEQLRIVCPHCQLVRDIPREKAPAHATTATCSRCKGRFAFDPATAAPPPGRQASAGPPLSPPPPRPAPAMPPPPRQARAVGPQPSTGAELRGIGELLGDAWLVFQSRFGTLFAIYLLFILAMVLPPVAGVMLGGGLAAVLPGGKGVVIGLFSTIGAIAGLLGFSWGWGACVAASLDETLDIRAAFAQGREKLLPFALVSFLVGFVITGGALLFIIPGIIFSVWFFFAHFVIFDDDTRGMSALLKSKAYVNGRWFDVFLRLMAIWACSAVIGAIPVVGPILTLVALPYVMVYQALLFRNLKEVAGPAVYSCGTGDKARWIGIAALGYVAVPAILLAMFGATLYRNLAPFLGKGMPALSAPAKIGTPSREGDFRIIPIPETATSSTPTSPAPSPSPYTSPAAPSVAVPFPAASAPDRRDMAKRPEHIHVFIYAVNYSGSVRANGTVIQELGTKPDMQYNYNLNGEKLVYGRNSVTVDYAPVKDSAATMKPRLHLKISYWNAGDKRILGDWEIKELESGQKTFDLEIPESLKNP